jgi:uncharacterized protein YjbI with pentapeptide repeats
MHSPDPNKQEAFEHEIRHRLETHDYDFTGAIFVYVDSSHLHDRTFNGPVTFRFAQFRSHIDFDRSKFLWGVDFSQASFHDGVGFQGTIFSALADFRDAEFGVPKDTEKDRDLGRWVNYQYAEFRCKADFAGAKFHRLRATGSYVSFTSAQFDAEAGFQNALLMMPTDFSLCAFGSAVDFRASQLCKSVDFRGATFGGDVRFGGTEPAASSTIASLDFRSARFEHPERVAFDSVKLRASYFIGTDPTKFEFTNVSWIGTIGEELQRITKLLDEPAARGANLLSKAYGALAANAENEFRYQEASQFRYRRLMTPRHGRRLNAVAFWSLDWWYLMSSGFGERVGQAFSVLLAVWLLSAALYTQVRFVRWEAKPTTPLEAAQPADTKGAPLHPFDKALAYSFGVMTLQKPEPRPASRAAQFVVGLETVVGPLQAALLALAVRRRYMRS